MLEKVRNIYDEMRVTHLERESEIAGLIIGLLTDSNVALLGEPGTAKSFMVNDLCTRIMGKYFSYLFTKFTTPDEIFGPVSLKGLEEDVYRRVTANKLPEADIVFADEGFKSNSALLNAMLKVANERVYDDGTGEKKLPLKMMVLASNELPIEEEGLQAFWDRFLLRYEVKYIREEGNFISMLKAEGSGSRTTLTMEELSELRNLVCQVTVPDTILKKLAKLRQALDSQNIKISDRRYKESLKLLKGLAFLNGRNTVAEDDLEILAHCYWNTPEEIKSVRKVLLSTVNPFGIKAAEEYDKAVEIYNNTIKQVEEKSAHKNVTEDEVFSLASKLGIESNVKFKKIINRLDELKNSAKQSGRDTSKVDEYIADVGRMNKFILDKYCYGRA